MKLSNFKATKEAVGFTLHYPDLEGEALITDEGKEVKLYLLGKASDTHQKIKEVNFKKMVARLNAKNKKEDPLSAEKLMKEEIEMLVALSVRIENLEDDDGKEINTKEQFEAIYSNPEFEWLKNQAKQLLDNDANFIKSADKS